MARPMSKQRFIKSFRPAVRQYIKDMYDKYQQQHPQKSVWAEAGKQVATESIPWVAIPTGIAALLRRDMYNTPEQRWSSAKWIGGTALLSALIRTAYALPKAYTQKKQQLPQQRALVAQQHIINQLQKNASQNDAKKVGSQAWWQAKWNDGKATLGSFALPGQWGDNRRMYALGGIGLLAALLSGGGLGRALLLGVLGLGAGYALNKWVLPKVDGWTQAGAFLDNIPNYRMRKAVQGAAGQAAVNYIFGETGGFGNVKDAMTAAGAEAAVAQAAKRTNSDVVVEVGPESITLTGPDGVAVKLDKGVSTLGDDNKLKEVATNRGFFVSQPEK